MRRSTSPDSEPSLRRHHQARFAGRTWPFPRSVDENLHDLHKHRDDFVNRRGFTYTVRDDDGEIIGCVYIYPSDRPGIDAAVHSSVRADRSHLGRPLWGAVSDWLRVSWPFVDVDYARRPADRDPS